MTERLVCACIQQDEIPQLHQMLNDENWKVYWPVIATVIGLASENEQSVPVLYDYFQRNDVGHLKNQFLDLIVMKLSVPQYLGKIGGSEAKEILMELTDEKTLLKAIQSWVDSDTMKTRWPNRQRLIANIRANAYYGLVYLQDPEADAFVEAAYRKGLMEYQRTKVGTPMWYKIVYAMGLKDCIAEIGLDEMLNMDFREKMKLTRSYMDHYAPYLKRKPMSPDAIKKRYVLTNRIKPAKGQGRTVQWNKPR